MLAGAMAADGALPQLERLRLASAAVGSDGTKAICAALRDYPSLKTLDLSHNRIDHVGAEAVGALLQLVAEPAAAAAGSAGAADA